MDLNISSHGTLVPEGHCCVLYATRRPRFTEVWHIMWFFTDTLIQYYTHKHTAHSGANKLTHPYKYVLANSGNTKCCPFQVKMNCSIFVIDGIQQRCHMTFLVSLSVTARNLLFGVFLPRKIITISQKIAINFRQVSPRGVFSQ